MTADFLIQSGLAKQIRFHGKRYPWFVSDVTRKDWEWLLNSMVYGHLFPKATEQERESLRRLGHRWKVSELRASVEIQALTFPCTQQYEREGKWVYEQHPFWCTGYTFWELHSEAPDLFLHLSRSDLVFFKGDLNHRKLTYDCAAPASTPFDIAIGPMASAAGAPKVCSLRTIKSDVVVGLESDETAERLDKEEPGWKISGKYVSHLFSALCPMVFSFDFLGCRTTLRGTSRGESTLRIEIQIPLLRLYAVLRTIIISSIL
jgi:damage-control phosphatase, subfamily III